MENEDVVTASAHHFLGSYKKFPCMMHIIRRGLCKGVSCFVVVYVASKLKLIVSSSLSLIWKMYKYVCQHMITMRFVSHSGDDIEKWVCGRGGTCMVSYF
jgi:hypothetical protein